MYKYIGTAHIPNETQIMNSTRKNEKFRYLHGLCNPKIYLKKMYIELSIMQRKSFGKLENL